MTKTSCSVRSGSTFSSKGSVKVMHKMRFLSIVTLAAGGIIGACAPEFRTECPPGKVRVGNGDVDEVCKEVAGAAGAAGDAGSAGSPPVSGSGGGGSGGVGGMVPGGECTVDATKCTEAGQQTCGADGRWGAAVVCDIECDGAGTKCVVPVQLAAGTNHMCSLLSDGTVRCWGGNRFGELGNNSTADAFKPQLVPGVQGATAIAAGNDNTCAVLSDKTASCWGANGSGQIGAGSSPVLVPTKLNLGNIAAISVGGNAGATTGGDTGHLCAIVEAGGKNVLKCVGSNGFGQLGTGTTNEVTKSFVDVKGISESVEKVAVGFVHTCALTKSGAVYCWGGNSSGQVDGDESEAPVLQPYEVAAVGGSSDIETTPALEAYNCSLKNDGVVYCWGANSYGKLGRGQKHSINAFRPGAVIGLGSGKKVSVADDHACAVLKDGAVWCWGKNSFGQLGVDCTPATCDLEGNVYYAKTPVQARVTGVEEITVGDFGTTCAITTDHKAFCWGDNRYGQLGIGQTIKSTSTPTPVVWK